MKLLYVQSIAEKKQRRQDSVQNQLRLGRFITQRKGAQFVEVWVDGFAFTDLLQRQEAVCSQREELERQRKQLTKRKPSSAGGQGQGGTGAGGKASRGGKQATVATSGEDGFTKPSALMSLSPQEYMERDELFKIRAALLKKVSICGDLANGLTHSLYRKMPVFSSSWRNCREREICTSGNRNA